MLLVVSRPWHQCADDDTLDLGFFSENIIDLLEGVGNSGPQLLVGRRLLSWAKVIAPQGNNDDLLLVEVLSSGWLVLEFLQRFTSHSATLEVNLKLDCEVLPTANWRDAGWTSIGRVWVSVRRC